MRPATSVTFKESVASFGWLILVSTTTTGLVVPLGTAELSRCHSSAWPRRSPEGRSQRLAR